MNNYEKLIKIIKEIFQLDQADLDFGIYRIMNQKRDEIEIFLTKDLLPQVRKSFEQYTSHDKSALQQELDKTIENAKGMGVDPETVPKVKELREKMKGATDVVALENEVFSLLANFFRRYYKDGDFISMRRYKKDVYAIPYEGEEVKLHWANHDQYYIKSSEYFKNYSFKLSDNKKVTFELVAAETEQNNNKAQEGKERRFAIVKDEPVKEESGELKIFFTYELNPESQDKLLNEAFETIKPKITQPYYDLLSLRPTEKNKKRTLLEKHLKDYSARNTFDYFIHKDLGGFLNRELDFYIKNEVLFIDDINTRNEADFTKQLSKIKALKEVAQKIIAFLEQLENFQKKLWLKKKFVVETNYCITLDRVPEELYNDIIDNKEQTEEWIKLFAINEINEDKKEQAKLFDGEKKIAFTNPLTIEFLKTNPYLVMDTAFFSNEFKTKLLASIQNIDEKMDGVLIHSDNFQAINTIEYRYKKNIDGIYIDPPYNTDASAIVYKNNYKDSSWISLMENRLRIAKNTLKDNSSICVAIDDEEVSEIRIFLNQFFAKEVGIAVVRTNPAGRKTKGTLAPAHEYALFYGNSDKSIPYSLELTDKRLNRYPNIDEQGRFAWANFIRSGTNDRREDRPKMHYPFYVNPSNKLRIPEFKWIEKEKRYEILEKPNDNESVVYPVVEKNGSKIEKRWQRGWERAKTEINEFRVRRGENDNISIDFKTRMDESSLPITWWDKKEYASANYGAAQLKELFQNKEFDFPKALNLVVDSLKVLSNKNNAIFFDFFSGSGTTGDAVISMNREDKGCRKYILVEMGEYFDNVTKPRIQKVVYSKDWKDGKPVSREGISHCFKYIRLESYEDTLNNLELKRSNEQGAALLQSEHFGEDYLLSYMLDVETDGSASLLNTAWFTNPFDYKLKITRNNETQIVKVDLPETFNYLIGLVVESIDEMQGFKVITGKNLQDEKILVIWRNTAEKDNKTLDNFFMKQQYNTRDKEFDRIYVNGDNNLENLKIGDEKWKVVLIEEEFKKRMFDVKEF